MRTSHCLRRYEIGQATIRFCVVALATVASACNETPLVAPSPGPLTIGTWGADTAGVIVSDSVVHVHIGCTLGDLAFRVKADAQGTFIASGTYQLRAFPIAVGPTVPAEFRGIVRGNRLTLTVIVNDTVTRTTVTKGPVTVELGVTPRMANCPVCVAPRVADRPSQVATGATARRWMLGPFSKMTISNYAVKGTPRK